MVHATHFSCAGPALRNVGGIRCLPFLATGYEHKNVIKWNRALRLLSKMELHALVYSLAS